MEKYIGYGILAVLFLTFYVFVGVKVGFWNLSLMIVASCLVTTLIVYAIELIYN